MFCSSQFPQSAQWYASTHVARAPQQTLSAFEFEIFCGVGGEKKDPEKGRDWPNITQQIKDTSKIAEPERKPGSPHF